jgi:hypothetical protein
MTRLGRLPHDPVALSAAPQHRFGAFRPLDRLFRSLTDWQPGLYDNDVYCDCTSVALYNHARGVEWMQAQSELAMSHHAPLSFFAECAGDPPNLLAVNGLVALDVINHAATFGIQVVSGELYPQYGVIRPTRIALARAMERFGGIYLGVTLHDRDMQTTRVWDTHGDPGPAEGGHMVNAWTYEDGLGDDATVYIGTWGYWQPVTWAWLEARVDEAYGPVWPQLARGDGSYLNRLTAQGLVLET